MVFVQALRLQRDGFSAEPANPVVARIQTVERIQVVQVNRKRQAEIVVFNRVKITIITSVGNSREIPRSLELC